MPWNIINSVKTLPIKMGVGGTWIASGNTPTYNTTRLAKSNNGTSWNGISYPWTNDYYFNDIAYGKDGAGNNLWVAVGIITGAQLATSTDGTNWTKATPAAFGSGYGIAYGKDGSGVGLWVCACQTSGTTPGNSIATSPDGINWTGQGRKGFLYGASEIAYGKDGLGNGLWIASSESRIIKSTNGTTWTTTYSIDYFSSIKTIKYGKNGAGTGLWILGGTGGYDIFVSSTNGGNTWSGNEGKNNFFSVNEVSYGKDGAGNGLWVAACGTLGASPDKSVAISSNGTTWTPVTINSTTIISNLKGVKYGKDDKGNGMWLAIGEGSNTIVKSINGTNWTGAGYVFVFGTAIAFSEIIVPP